MDRIGAFSCPNYGNFPLIGRRQQGVRVGGGLGVGAGVQRSRGELLPGRAVDLPPPAAGHPSPPGSRGMNDLNSLEKRTNDSSTVGMGGTGRKSPAIPDTVGALNAVRRSP